MQFLMVTRYFPVALSIKYGFSYLPKNDPKVFLNASNASSNIPEVFFIIPVELDVVPVDILLFSVNIVFCPL
jgi:hypothetical protein